MILYPPPRRQRPVGEPRWRQAASGAARAVAWLACVWLTLGGGCRRAADVPPSDDAAGAAPASADWFVDVAPTQGLSFVHEAGPLDERYFMPQVLGSGAAVIDFDGDGRLDLVLLQNGGPDSAATNRLYHQQPSGQFADVSEGSGLDFADFCMGTAVGDVNNDGHPDLYVTCFGADRLFANRGDGHFSDVTTAANIDNAGWGTSAAFFDYDRDGRLDLAVANYVLYDPTSECGWSNGRRDYCNPKHFSGAATRLYRNRTVPGTSEIEFEDVTLASGLGTLDTRALGVVGADFDDDGWPDLFVANDAGPNRLWINDRRGGFRDQALLRGVAYDALGHAAGNMGIALGDVDGDGLDELLVTHLTEETHTLWRQHPAGAYQDRSGEAGLWSSPRRGTGFGAVLADFDLDGWLDAAVVNGRVSQFPGTHAASHWLRYAERNQLFRGDGRGGLADVSATNESFCGPRGVFRGLAFLDFDNDGALDLLATEVAGPARLWRNVAPRRGHWLAIRAYDPALRREAHGAAITVRCGPRAWVRQVLPGQSYLSSNDPRAHFGLGEVAAIDELRVVWPDGLEEAFDPPGLDRTVTLNRGEGRMTNDQ